ncbi:uncharacterized protein K460DRAFT_371331 [Cucurbitaria berberidis CBS 394.84]|uniref:Uncharacterized protein n=1 Tax=Cucurbitaria berberidis CBS 394.84 TaxID=1168544 RepID=A0A9P4G708_9PLEO|nr:uncharacterized protein K460DRAFT_371331 [Cucurbitaria berberidis CBS 394.84]KAF1840117.1 hypothetical protein K460DRAFT_371331 [Cucurbitaria berberidis CBS 394.84]
MSSFTFGLFTNTLTTDVTCDEVCVFCCIHFQETHKFLRHVDECHKKEEGRKALFISSTCGELMMKVTHELHVARHKPSSDINVVGKRRRVDSDVDYTERAGKVRAMNNGHQIAQAVNQLSYSRQPTLTFIGTGGESSSVNMNGAVDMNRAMNSADIHGGVVMNGAVDMHGAMNSADIHGGVVMNRTDMNGRVVVDSVGMNGFGESPGIISSPPTFWGAQV